MHPELLSAALERDHREIDAVIGAFIDELAECDVHPEPMVEALDALRRHIYVEARLSEDN